MEAAAQFKPWFKDRANLIIPEVRVSCGLPSRGAFSRKKRTIGECWGGMCAADKIPQLFISPVLQDAETDQGVLATLVHELEHATIGVEAKHGPKFKRSMLLLGLAGKPTATVAGPELLEFIKKVSAHCGIYPHSGLFKVENLKKQSTRLIKCECEKDACGYNVRVTRKWLEVGAPVCPCAGHGAMSFDAAALEGYGEEGGDE